ncbi:hypothetical protein ACFE04_006929 [Oxalis oulophora]
MPPKSTPPAPSEDGKDSEDIVENWKFKLYIGGRVWHQPTVHYLGGQSWTCKAGKAIKFVRVCGGKDSRLDGEIFKSLTSRLIKKKIDKEALEVVEEMKKKGLQMGQKLKDFCKFNE